MPVTIQQPPHNSKRRGTHRLLYCVCFLSLFLAFSLISKGIRYPSAVDYGLELQLDVPSVDSVSSSLNSISESISESISTVTESLTESFFATSGTATSSNGLPKLAELTEGNYSCPEGTLFYENLVLPESITHANRKIPQVVHVTAKTRCVTPMLAHNLDRWKFANHSLYFHDDQAAYKLLQYSISDKHNHELILGLSKMLRCISNGATMSDMWRYILLYHYGGIYTDIDNSPGRNYTTDFITPSTDSFFFIEGLGVMSQYYLASSRHHPLLLHMIRAAIHHIYNDVPNNVMKNHPAKKTGPGAVKVGMILFQKSVNITTNGYMPAGEYSGGLGPMVEHDILPWLDQYHEDVEYPQLHQLQNRSVTVYGNKEHNKLYVNRDGFRRKGQAWAAMNMSHYHSQNRDPGNNAISCMQHSERMDAEIMKNTSYYYQKYQLQDLLPQYEFRPEDNHFFDKNTNEMLVPWDRERIKVAQEEGKLELVPEQI